MPRPLKIPPAVAYSPEFQAMLDGNRPKPTKRKGKAESVAAFVNRAGSETDLSKSMHLECERHGIYLVRMNSGSTRIQNPNGSYRVVKGGPEGTSDRIGQLPDGRFFALEVKVPGNWPTRAQVDYLIARNRANGVAVWANSVRDLRRLLGPILAGGRVDVSSYGRITVTNPSDAEFEPWTLYDASRPD